MGFMTHWIHTLHVHRARTSITQDVDCLLAELGLYSVPLSVPLFEVRIRILNAHQHNFARVRFQHAFHAYGCIGYYKR